MNRRNFLKLIPAAILAPFIKLPEPKEPTKHMGGYIDPQKTKFGFIGREQSLGHLTCTAGDWVCYTAVGNSEPQDITIYVKGYSFEDDEVAHGN